MVERGKAVSAALQDYLEAILKLNLRLGPARVRDLANELSVHKSTVSAALRSLAERGLVNYSPYEPATLTPQGRRVAEKVCRTHHVLKRFMTDVLFVDEDVAGENACRMEHVVDRRVQERLLHLERFMHERPKGGLERTEGFRRYLHSAGADRNEPDSIKEAP